MQVSNVVVAADDAVLARRQALAFAVAAGGHAKNSQSPSMIGASPVTIGTVPAATSIDWPCVAEAETGSDFSMHGSTYSTAYGVVNEIVYQYASPEVQARVFSGTASEAEQTDIVARFAADHGTDGWGELTKEKCGL